MCGFVGFLSGEYFDKSLVQKMGDAIAHRGPDASGYWSDNEKGIHFCHRRLSIIDLSEAGAQPMSSPSGRYVIAFNGEIYNFLDIKVKLEKEGYKGVWKGHSDTEVINAGFDFWGIQRTVELMIGMFAISVWDTKEAELFLIRDRMGEKPLYFGWQGSSFLFGSELKSFQAHPEFKKEICLNALGQFFKYNCVPSDMSIYKGVEKLKPGTYCKVSLLNKEVKHYTYWQLNEKIKTYGNSEYNVEERILTLENLLKDAISKQMIADVPLGAFLSGGVDSSVIVALMQNISSKPIKTFSMGFNEKSFDEAIYAKEVARHLGTDHSEMYVSPQQAMGVIPLLSDIYDEPFSDPSQIPTYLVSKLAKSKVTVSLSGDAGDELFCGYDRYLMINNVWGKLSKVPKTLRTGLGNFLSSQKVDRLNSFYNGIQPIVPQKYKLSNFGDKMHKIASKLDVSTQSELYDGFISHWRIDEILSSDASNTLYDLEKIEGLSFIEKMMYADSMSYLPDDILVKVDRAAMSNSLETRVPFLDHRVVEFAWNLPMSLKFRDGKGKWILRQVLYKHVPQKLIDRPKKGFGIPLESWLRGPLKDWAFDMLSSSNLNKHGYLNNKNIHQKLSEHMSGTRDWKYQLWDVLMFQSWFNKYH